MDRPSDRLLRIMTVNVTSLTKARLVEVLRTARLHDADVIALQEVRHRTTKVGWASAIARRNCMGWQASKPPPADGRGRIGCGRTALLWKLRMGKSKALIGQNHRAVGRAFGSLNIVSYYGNAQTADLQSVEGTLRLAE